MALLGRVGLFWVNVQNLHLVGQMALLGRVGLFWIHVYRNPHLVRQMALLGIVGTNLVVVQN